MTELIEAVGVWWWVLAVAVGILGTGRLTRVLVHDEFPPAAWLRQKWSDWVNRHNHQDWGMLLFCWWCAAPWIMAVTIGTFALSFLHPVLGWAWWLFWGWLALSYVASMVVARDEPEQPAPAAAEDDE